MNASQFKAALDTVEQDHQAVLDNVQALKETANLLLDSGRTDMGPVLGRLREIHAYFATQFEAHMEEEETALFPLLDCGGDECHELAARLRAEHTEIRRRRDELGNCLAVAEGLEGGPPRMVLRDALAYAWELWEFLDNHAHAESRGLHACIGRTLPSSPPAAR